MLKYRVWKYEKQAAKLMTPEEQAVAEASVVAAPEYWPIVPETGGARKARIPLEGRGKRGGGRVIYFWQSRAGKIFFIMVYAKGQQEDLSHGDKKAIAKTVAAIKAQEDTERSYPIRH